MVAAVKATAKPDLEISGQKPIFATFDSPANAMDNSGAQDIFTLDVKGLSRITISLTVATNALAAFVIKAAFNDKTAPLVTLAHLNTDYTAPSGVLVETSGDLTALGVGTGYFILDVAGMSSITLQANSSAAGGSTLSLSGGGV